MSVVKRIFPSLLVVLLASCSGGGDRSGGGSKDGGTGPVGVSVDNLSPINIASEKAFILSGTCLEEGGSVQLTLTDSDGQTVNTESDALVCSREKAWSFELDTTDLAEGEITVVVIHVSSEREYRYEQTILKDVVAPEAPGVAAGVVASIKRENAGVL